LWDETKDGKIHIFEPGGKDKVIKVSQVPRLLLGQDPDHLFFLNVEEKEFKITHQGSFIENNLVTGQSRLVKTLGVYFNLIVLDNLLLAWVDNRNGFDEVYALSVKDGSERQVSQGFGHRHALFVKKNKILWDDIRNGIQTLHVFDWTTGKDETLWSFGSNK